MSQIPIFYINMADRPDRRRFMEDQLARLRLVAERVEAVVADDISDQTYARYVGTLSRALSRAEVACSSSHQFAWATIAKRRLPLALVLEDDAVLSDRLPRFLDQLGGMLPKPVEVLRLEAFPIPVRLSAASMAVGAHSLRRLLSTTFGSCAYLLSADTAARALRSRSKFRLAVDEHLFSTDGTLLFRYGVYQVEPALGIQANHLWKDAVSASSLDGVRSNAGSQQVMFRKFRRGVRRRRAQVLGSIFFGRDKGLLRPLETITFAGPGVYPVVSQVT